MKYLRSAIAITLALVISTAWAQTAGRGAQAEYIGGTLRVFEGPAKGTLHVNGNDHLIFWSSASGLKIPYGDINLLEYGQKVERRVGAAVILSPLFLLAKSRRHFLTVGFSDEKGQQAAVFRIHKNAIRSILVSLEAKTGRKVEYQDQAARLAGKG